MGSFGAILSSIPEKPFVSMRSQLRISSRVPREVPLPHKFANHHDLEELWNKRLATGRIAKRPDDRRGSCAESNAKVPDKSQASFKTHLIS
jgi:hypothetical protein